MRIGKFEILGLLGRGGMGAVYKVRVPVIGRIAALKLLKPHELLLGLLGEQEVRSRFLAEAVTMAGIRNPHVAEIWDYGEAGGWPWFLMEYYCNNLGAVIGETYRVEEPTRILGLDKAARYSLEMLAGLERLHHAGIVHRDIKPFNILLTEDDTVKITDFGLSRLRGETQRCPANLKIGSPYYAAPEQEAAPDQAGPEADLYAVGVMLHRMLTGLLPNCPEQGPVRPSSVNPDLDPGWDAFLAKATAADPGERFRDAGAMAAALEGLRQAWHDRIESVCRLGEEPPEVCSTDRTRPSARPRAVPAKVRPAEARQAFGLDELWRPRVYTANDFRAEGEVVADLATGLLWQRSGTPYPLPWERAGEHVRDALCRGAVAGCGDWRLPTVEEACTLLCRTPHMDDYCVEQVFDRRQQRLWTADRKSFLAAWYADATQGFVGWQDFSCGCHVRAVRTMSEQEIEQRRREG